MSTETLDQHLRWVNYQVAIWKRAHEANPILPSPTDGNCWTTADGQLEPLWTDGDIIPKSLVDDLEDVQAESFDEENENDEEDDGDVIYSDDEDDDTD